MKSKTWICLFLFLCLLIYPRIESAAWGFFAHRKINRFAVYGLPPQMMVFFKPNIEYLALHAPDPDKMRYAIKEEGAHHFIDIDVYGTYPYPDLPRKWSEAVEKFTEDTLLEYGTVPWYSLQVFYRLEKAFKEQDAGRILRYSAHLGHYIADASVPLHATSNYDGQKTGQKGIHALWESGIPELLADSSFVLWTGKAEYVERPGDYIWEIVLESALAADTVLSVEKELSETYPSGEIHAFTKRNGKVVKNYSDGYKKTYNGLLNGMVERRMRRAIHATSSLWYTAWIRAGQPDLSALKKENQKSKTDELGEIDRYWHDAGFTPERVHEEED